MTLLCQLVKDNLSPKLHQTGTLLQSHFLLVKKVNHSFGVDDAEKVAYVGKVISQVPGFPDWFNIVHDNHDAVYSYRLIEDYQDGNLEIIP